MGRPLGPGGRGLDGLFLALWLFKRITAMNGREKRMNKSGSIFDEADLLLHKIFFTPIIPLNEF